MVRGEPRFMARLQNCFVDPAPRVKMAKRAALELRRRDVRWRQEVGSELDFDQRSIFWPRKCTLKEAFSNTNGSLTLLQSGRSAIRSVLSALVASTSEPLRFLLPSYLCPAVLQPFQDLKVPYDFYPVDDCLFPDWGQVSRYIDTRACTGLLFIRYFGAAQHGLPPASLFGRKGDFFVIDDLAQAMLSPRSEPHGDYIVYSARKFFGLPDGGAVVAKRDCPIPR